MTSEWLVAENVLETLWLRLKRLTSITLCRKIIERKHPSLSPEISEKKASDMSWAVRSALGYWETKSGGLNSRILSRYYALLQISMAEQIGSENPDDDLPSIQRYTESGHGLFTISDNGTSSFPSSYFIGCLRSGHYYEYCKHLGINLSPLIFDRRPHSFHEIDSTKRSKLISLEELLCRVPELQAVIGESFGRKPLSFHIGYANRNHQLKIEQTRANLFNHFSQNMPSSPSAENEEQETTYISIYTHGYEYSLEEIKDLDLPIKNIGLEHDPISNTDHFTGAFVHPKGHWGSFLKPYKSGYSGTSLVVPFWGINDPFLLHLTVLYGFSIVVRYLPDLWHRIEDGDLDHIRTFLEHYLVIVDNVLPKIIVERLTGIHLLITQPGSLNSQV